MNKIKNEAMEVPVVTVTKKDPANSKLPDPDLYDFWSLYNDRVIFIDGELDEYTNFYVKQILRWNAEDAADKIPVEKRKPIKILLDSPGGFLANALELADVITMSKTKVITINMCEASSGAFLVLIAGHERLSLKYATAMVHSGSGKVSGTFEQTQNAASSYKKMIKNMRDFILEKTGIPSSTLTKKSKTDWYLEVSEMQKYGCIDKVIDNIEDVIGDANGE